jgi:hypothetical protein
MASSPEQKKSYQVVKNFKGVNTKANRTAIDETEFAWLENAMPVGYANLRIIPAPTTLPVTAANTITQVFSCNLNNKDYVLAFEADGRCEYLDVTNFASLTKGNVAAAGTFSNAGVNIAQWKNSNVIIGDPTNGLYSWDGANLVSVGAVGTIALKNKGTGYTSTPAVIISAPNQTGGTQATATAVLSANTVGSITITEAGTGYTSPPTVTITGGGGTNANAVAALTTFKTGTVNVLVTNGGAGYTNSSNITVTISGGGGAGANAAAILSGNQVSQIVMTNPGSGYTNSANITVTIAGGGGSNASAKAIINSNNVAAVQTFSGRLWVAQGRSVSYSAAGTFSDFVSVSAGTVTLTDSTLHSNIIQLLSANNFLYIFGDDSINVFSDVRVTSAGTTLFTNTNVSASVGTKLPYAIFPYFRSVLFMNQYGVYALVGSTTSKISDALDGIFANIDFTTATVTAGQVLLNNILCAAFNIRYYDSNIAGYRYIQAVFFEKKWFFTSQGNAIKLITSVPANGQIYLAGTDGTTPYLFYDDNTVPIASTIQSALWQMGDPIRTKQALKAAVEASNLTSVADLSLTIDNENRSSSAYTLTSQIVWTNNSLQTIAWSNNLGASIGWGITGFSLYKTDAQQWGKYLGLTITSNSPAFVINGLEMEHELRARF